MKKIIIKVLLMLLLSITSILVFVSITFIYDVHFSDYGIKCKKNLYNSKMIKIGMTEYQVIKIMGKPDKSYINNDGQPCDCYDLNIDLFKDYGCIEYDSNKTVVKFIRFPNI